MVCGGVCSDALRTFWALGVHVYGNELYVDFGVLAHRIDTRTPVMYGSFACSLIYQGMAECLCVFWGFAATGVCAIDFALISVCVAETASVGVKCPLVSRLVIARFGMGLEFSWQAPDRGIP